MYVSIYAYHYATLGVSFGQPGYRHELGGFSAVCDGYPIS
jgi:hypothetical protein